MRLINANGSYTLNASDNTGYSLGFGGGIISVADEYGHIVAEFFADDAPTIEAEPVRHGRWITRNKGMNNWVDCSECGTIGSLHWRRCPVCEAKMDVPDINAGNKDGGAE